MSWKIFFVFILLLMGTVPLVRGRLQKGTSMHVNGNIRFEKNQKCNFTTINGNVY